MFGNHKKRSVQLFALTAPHDEFSANTYAFAAIEFNRRDVVGLEIPSNNLVKIPKKRFESAEFDDYLVFISTVPNKESRALLAEFKYRKENEK